MTNKKPHPSSKPLVVDLDGTLIKSDLLLESLFSYLKLNPLYFFKPFIWLIRGGKANLKSHLAEKIFITVEHLPYNEKVLHWLQKEKSIGRKLVLATASHQQYAEQVAAHLGLFDQIIATDNNINISANNKKNALVKAFGEKGFDYAGNSADDLKVWQAADCAFLVDPEFGVERRARSLDNVTKVIRSNTSHYKPWIKALRLHQWLKNILLFVPLLATHQIFSLPMLLVGILTFIFFGLCASSVYILNDLFDLQDDRHHTTKKNRPFASGTLSIKSGLLLTFIFLFLAFFGSALLLPNTFLLVLTVYYLLTLSYSLLFKRIMMLDVVILATLYTLRIIAGIAAFKMQPTFWVLVFSMFIFTSLAFVKRYTELRDARAKGNTQKARGRGYYPSDLEMISSLGAASGYLSVLVLALYVQDNTTIHLYSHPKVIWLACPLLLFWVSRIWLLTHRGLMHEDPVTFAAKDYASLFIVFLLAIIFWAAT